MTATLEDAIALAADAHRGQLYPAPEPEPYILHPLRVMLAVSPGRAQIVAVLHDVIEDTELTLDDLRQRGFDDDTVHAVDLLSKRAGEPYMEYINRLAPDALAREVKLADLDDNLANNRRLTPSDDTRARVALFERARQALLR